MNRFLLTTGLVAALCAPATGSLASGMGLLCAYSITVSVHAWAKTCTSQRETEIKQLETLIDRFRQNVRDTAQADDAWIEGFEAQMGGNLTNNDCDREDVTAMSHAFLQDVSAVENSFEHLLSQKTPPQWGTCL